MALWHYCPLPLISMDHLHPFPDTWELLVWSSSAKQRIGMIKSWSHEESQGSVNTPRAPWLSTHQHCPRVSRAFVP